MLLDEAISKLNKLIAGQEKRKPTLELDWESLDIDGFDIKQNGTPVFLLDWNFKPGSTMGFDTREFFGSLGGYYYSIQFLRENADGSIGINPGQEARLRNLKSGNFGAPFLGMRLVPDFIKKAYPDFTKGGSTFTGFDIDHPQARKLHKTLFEKYVPFFKGKNMSKLGYMLSNEPHWNTSGTWDVVEITAHTKSKFVDWLKRKHGTITEVNNLWSTSFSNFRQAANSFVTPVNKSLRGSPQYYDFMRFNQNRVTEWFTFLRDEIKKIDPDAKTHIKLIPGQWYDGSRDNGLDFEALTNLTEIIGHDAEMKHSTRWGKNNPWQEKYILEWRDLAISYDFFQSIKPNAINYNSEGHSLLGSSMDVFLRPSYARASQWISTIHGGDVTTNWAWLRNADGSLKSNFKLAASTTQQPRILNELHATMIDLNTYGKEISDLQHIKSPMRFFYSETSAINKPNHMTQLKELYEDFYFEGYRLGFATENIIKKQNAKNWEFIVVSNTEYATYNEFKTIQNYLDNGGTVLIDGISLRKNEYGKNRSARLTSGSGTLLNISNKNIKAQVLALLDQRGYKPAVKVMETNSVAGFKGVFPRSVRTKNGKNIISLVNVGKDKTKIELSLGTNTNVSITNMLTGTKLNNNFDMIPEQVLLLEVAKESGNSENNIIVNGFYNIQNIDTAQNMTASQSDNHNATMLNTSKSEDQVWEFIHLGNGIHKIKNINTERYLEVGGGRCANDANINTWTTANVDHHKWYITKIGENHYLRPLHCTDRAMDKSIGSNGNVKIWKYNKNNKNQKFKLVPVNASNTIIVNGTYTIESANTGQHVISPNWEDFNVRMYRKLSAKDQQWVFEHIGNRKHTIKNVKTGRYLESFARGCGRNTNLNSWPTLNGGNHQQWLITKIGDNHYLRPSHCEDFAMDKSRGIDGNVKLWNFNTDNNNQKFKLIPVSITRNFDESSAFSIYPNPTNGILYIDTLQKDYKVYSIVVYGVLGNIVKTIDKNLNENQSIDISDLNSGLYMIAIKSHLSSNNDQTTSVFKIFKE